MCNYNLKFNGFALKLNGADFEVDTDGADVTLGICVIGKSQQKATLAHARVANKKKLEKIVAVQMHKQTHTHKKII